jgi:lipoprotein NlpD
MPQDPGKSARWLAGAAALLLGACASTGPAPVEDLSLGSRGSPRARPAAAAAVGGATYRVERGDTLYSIAFRNGVDYRELAQWNGIDAPYTIYVGQSLRTTPPGTRTAPPRVAAVKPTAETPRAVPAPTPFEPVAGSAAGAPRVAATAAGSATAPAAAATATPSPTPPPSASPAPAPSASGAIGWRWPADGTLAGRFAAGDPTRQGLDIAGKAGDPVRAAAAGTVVYSGNGLIGYGELVIVKHSPAWLSAYGHNRKRLVKEGDKVAAGQVIAEMGSSSASRDSLHFEIRRNGKPVDPLGLLPRR